MLRLLMLLCSNDALLCKRMGCVGLGIGKYVFFIGVSHSAMKNVGFIDF